MADQNHTPIHHIIEKHLGSNTSGKETEPGRSSEPLVFNESGEMEHFDEEVQKHVEVHDEKDELDEEVKNAGVEVATKEPQTIGGNLKLPLSDDKIMENLHRPVSSSGRWMAELAKYIFAQSHIVLKTIHGKVTRVLVK